MRSLLLAYCTAAIATAAASLISPPAAKAMTMTTPAGLSVAIQEATIKQDVQCGCGGYGYAYSYGYAPYAYSYYRPYAYGAYAYRPYAYGAYAYGAYAYGGYGPGVWVGWGRRGWR
jgi:hypothetical protein